MINVRVLYIGVLNDVLLIKTHTDMLLLPEITETMAVIVENITGVKPTTRQEEEELYQDFLREQYD